MTTESAISGITFNYTVTNSSNNDIVQVTPPQTIQVISDFASISDFKLETKFTNFTASLTKPDDVPTPFNFNRFQIDYQGAAGWQVASVVPKENIMVINNHITGFAQWVFGDNSKSQVSIRFVDSTDQTFQPDMIQVKRDFVLCLLE